MYKIRKSILFKLIVAILILISIIFIFFSLREKDTITNYIKNYYGQVVVYEKDDSKVKSLLSFSVDAKGDSNKSYTKYLTKDYIEKISEEDTFSNNTLEEYGKENNINAMDLNNMKFVKTNKNEYEVKYDLVLKDKSNNVNLIRKKEIYNLEKENNNILINNITEIKKE